jgi:hypothetical protein
MEQIIENAKKRFNAYWIQDTNGCHLWQGHKDKDGYGIFYFYKASRRAHRVSYYFFIGEIPNGMFIDHICKNRSCVNVSHLRIVSPRENSLFNSNSVGAINSQKTHCKYGHILDKKYGKQRYCSVCSAEKSKRLYLKWKEQSKIIKC